MDRTGPGSGVSGGVHGRLGPLVPIGVEPAICGAMVAAVRLPALARRRRARGGTVRIPRVGLGQVPRRADLSPLQQLGQRGAEGRARRASHAEPRADVRERAGAPGPAQRPLDPLLQHRGKGLGTPDSRMTAHHPPPFVAFRPSVSIGIEPAPRRRGSGNAGPQARLQPGIAGGARRPPLTVARRGRGGCRGTTPRGVAVFPDTARCPSTTDLPPPTRHNARLCH